MEKLCTYELNFANNARISEDNYKRLSKFMINQYYIQSKT